MIFAIALAFTERLIPSTLYAKLIRRLLKIAVKSHSHSMKPYRIPLNLLHKFSLTEITTTIATDAFDCPSLLTQLESAGLTYFYDSFCTNLISGSSDEERFKLALAAAGGDTHFTSFLIPFLMRLGINMVGTRSRLNKRCRYGSGGGFVEKFESKRPGTRLVVGDHGMIDVNNTIDVEDLIRGEADKAKFACTDYTYFLDPRFAEFGSTPQRQRVNLPKR